MTTALARARERLSRDQLTRGSVNLIANNVSATGLGFLGWIVTTRMFSPDEVGTAAAWISAAGLAASLAMLGTPGTMLRFLPNAQDQRRLLSTALTVSLGAAAVIALGIGLTQRFQPQHLSTHILGLLTFVGFVVLLVAKAVLEAATVAVRASGTAVYATSAANTCKIGAVAGFGWLGSGALGILGAQLVAVVTNVALLVRRLHKRRVLGMPTAFDRRLVARLRGYSLTHYVNGLVGGVPLMVLPLIVKHQLGSEATAYWYVASLMAQALFLLPAGVGMSLLVEGSHERQNLARLVTRASRGLAAIMIPAVLAAVLLAPFALRLFGANYLDEALAPFRVLALSAVLVSASYVLGNVLFIRRRLFPLTLLNLANAVTVIALAWVAGSLVGVAWAWVAGEVVNLILFAVLIPLFPERADRPADA